MAQVALNVATLQFLGEAGIFVSILQLGCILNLHGACAHPIFLPPQLGRQPETRQKIARTGVKHVLSRPRCASTWNLTEEDASTCAASL